MSATLLSSKILKAKKEYSDDSQEYIMESLDNLRDKGNKIKLSFSEF